MAEWRSTIPPQSCCPRSCRRCLRGCNDGSWLKWKFGCTAKNKQASLWATKKPSTEVEGLILCAVVKLFAGRVHGDTAGLVLSRLFSFCLLDAQGFVDPMISGFQILRTGSFIVALHIGAFTVHEVHVRHCVVIVWTKLNRLVQAVDAFLDRGC